MLAVHGFGALEEPLPPLGRGPNETGKFLWTFWDGSTRRFQPTNVPRDEMEPTVFVLGGKFDQGKQVVRSGNIKTPKVTQSGKRLENFCRWEIGLGKNNGISVSVKTWILCCPATDLAMRIWMVVYPFVSVALEPEAVCLL